MSYLIQKTQPCFPHSSRKKDDDAYKNGIGKQTQKRSRSDGSSQWQCAGAYIPSH